MFLKSTTYLTLMNRRGIQACLLQKKRAISAKCNFKEAGIREKESEAEKEREKHKGVSY